VLDPIQGSLRFSRAGHESLSPGVAKAKPRACFQTGAGFE